MERNLKREENLKLWKSLKFGLFVHWGIYAVPAQGEWYMYNSKVPVKEYEKYAYEFNPKDYDPEKWVLMAKDAGMKYIVFTTKHHDGFSMFKTDVDSFNVVDATPYGKDALKELADACRKHDMKLGLYYSHVREWRHPLAQSYEPKSGRPDLIGNYGNFWDYPDEGKKDLQRYIDEFDKPQLKELLTNYGDILTIWFDTASHINDRQAIELRDWVYSLQETCLINGRLCGNKDLVDYLSMGDNAISAFPEEKAWESAMTFGYGWGYFRDPNYEDYTVVLKKFVEIIAKGGNLLLNVGPDENGVVPEKAQQELKKIGQWIRKNEDAIYDVEPLKLPYLCDWGYVAKKDNKIYLYITDSNADEVGLTGIKTKVVSCKVLENNKACEFNQNEDGIGITIGKGANDEVRIIEIECDGDIVAENKIIPNYEGNVYLTGQNGTLNINYPYSKMTATNMHIRHWLHSEDTITWNFSTKESGKYSLEVVIAGGGYMKQEDVGHEIFAVVDGKSYEIPYPKDAVPDSKKRILIINDVNIEKGEHELVLKPKKISSECNLGLKFQYIKLNKE